MCTVPVKAGATRRLTDAGAAVIAAPRATPWKSFNSRLQAPAGLTVTPFQELGSTGEQASDPVKTG
ncbi:hypothetical protein E3T23_02695 [Cryobacterium cheniae]|uniref:Uncharacterized protein n=1 Tax=Cryobacterium cheniae TaxID=1259262 RepID=A0A4R8XXG3_9MICO|nr:hypothetical protein [Cryobacterium cheniae]TFC83294.1 hypothetical protein E3T23_02695 [Cryobacterium cheniae]